MPAWVLVLVLVSAAMLALTALPIPLWIGRALRPSRPRLELAPAPEAAGPRVRNLITDVRVARQAVADAIEATRDLISSLPWARWLVGRTGNEDGNWAASLFNRTASCQTEAREAVAAVDEQLGSLPEAAWEPLVRAGIPRDQPFADPDASTALARFDESVSFPGAVPRRSVARATLHELEHTAATLERLEHALHAHAGTPYR